MNFKTDENLPVEVVQILAGHGHDALSVIDRSLAGHAEVVHWRTVPPDRTCPGFGILIARSHLGGRIHP